MNKPFNSTNRRFILPGEFYITKKAMTLGTVLGSCVSVCLHNEVAGISGMNHFVFPHGDNVPNNQRGSYGNTAIELIARSLFMVDKDLSHYTAKIFGGASPLMTESPIGVKNIATAEKSLAKLNIRVIERVLGGTSGYRIHFDTGTGQVTSKEIVKKANLHSEKKRVLIVDDSSMVRKVLRTCINSLNGYEVCGEAEDAYQARDLLVTLKPDIMILDIIMPKMDGISFLQKVMLFLPMPVIICSTIAKKGSSVRKDAFAAGALEVIDKDTLELYKNPEQVKNTIEAQLNMALQKFKLRC